MTISVTLINSYGDDYTAAEAARVSTRGTAREDVDRDNRLIDYLLSNAHTSPFEHAGATFCIKTPIFSARQIMRHRTFSYNEISRRYTSGDVEFYVPQKLHTQHSQRLQCSTDQEPVGSLFLIEHIKNHMMQSLDLYHHLLERGVSREQARYVLPLNTMTTFWMTGNLHNWLRFLSLRTHTDTQEETRIVAQAIRLHLSSLFPVTLDLYQRLNEDQ